MIVKNVIMTIAEQNSEHTASRQTQQQQRKSNPLDQGVTCNGSRSQNELAQ
jgi:hypothetical protein